MIIQGDTLQELFTAALEGMSFFMKKETGTSQDYSQVKEVSLEASTVTFLLIDFLSEALTLSHIHKIIFGKVQFKRLTKGECVAQLYGRKEMSLDKDIKAVTYHEAHVKRNEKGVYETTLIFDI